MQCYVILNAGTVLHPKQLRTFIAAVVGIDVDFHFVNS